GQRVTSITVGVQEGGQIFIFIIECLVDFLCGDVIANNRKLARRMADAVSELHDHPHVAEVRQTGMILAIEMVRNKATGETYAWQERRGMRVYQHGLQQGVLLRPLANVVYFMPPYVINDDEIQLMAKTAIDGIQLATRD
ncbi:MAG: aminotransferase class III-fold pyridoxal phosphate-dependent enzyme, partial [Gammaproteobacteria bacterium]